MRTRSFIAVTVTMLATAVGSVAAQGADSVARANVRGILEAIDRNESGIWAGDRDDPRGRGEERARSRRANEDYDRGDRRDRDDRWDRRDRQDRERELARWRKDRERQVRSCERDLWKRVRDEDRWDRRGRDTRSVKERIHQYCERRVWERDPRIWDRYPR